MSAAERVQKPNPGPLLTAEAPVPPRQSSTGSTAAPLPAVGATTLQTPPSSALQSQRQDRASSPSGPPPQPLHWEPNDPARGWEPRQFGRLRFSLCKHFKGDEAAAPSAFANVLPEDLSPAKAAARQEEEDTQTPTNGALLNVCDEEEPHVELELQASMINAINSAYTSSGYPSVMAAGNTRGSVYGSFVDLKNPSVVTLNYPPRETVVVVPCRYSADDSDKNPSGKVSMDTLMKIMWHRSSNLFTSNVESLVTPNASQTFILPAAAAATGMARPSSLQQHIQQFPDGVHGKHSAPNMRAMLLSGEYPTTAEAAAAFPVVAPAAAQPAAAVSSPSVASPGSPHACAAANVPPPGVSAKGSAPVQHTLVAANTFNHLSVYFVAHQDGKFLYNAPVQTLSASIATRKVTAHSLFFVGREEVDPVEDLDGYELMFTSRGSSSLASPAGSPGSPFKSASQSGYDGSSGGAAAGPAQSDCVNGKRKKLSFRQLAVPADQYGILFDSTKARFRGADVRRRTINAALVGFQLEPMLMFGNQNGDIFIHSILEERIIQRINFNNGSSAVNATTSSASGGKLIASPVSCIVEVQNGLEKKLGSLVQNAALAKEEGRTSFAVEESVKYPAGRSSDSDGYFPLSPSLFAVGFDCGQILLLCVTTEGGWMLKNFSNNSFGFRPIQGIAVRVPSFYTRLWAYYAAAPATAASARSNPQTPSSVGKASHRSSSTTISTSSPCSTLVVSSTTLFVPDEEQHVAAISCNGGTIVLVRLPGLEVLSSISVYDFNAVGELLTLAWTTADLSALLLPDVLIASGEDDTMTAFKLISTAVIPPANTSRNGMDLMNSQTVSSNESFAISSGLRVVEKKHFHRSWVGDVSVLPVVLPLARSKVGMPQFLGTTLLASSYDSRTSFWPVLFRSSNNSSLDYSGDQTQDDDFLLIDGPSAAYSLHDELVVGTAVGGGGTSYFVASVCCRGRVRFWSCAVK